MFAFVGTPLPARLRGLSAPAACRPRTALVAVLRRTQLGTDARVVTTPLRTAQTVGAETRQKMIALAFLTSAAMLARRLLINPAGPAQHVMLLSLLLATPGVAVSCITKAGYCIESLKKSASSLIQEDELAFFISRCWWSAVLAVAGLCCAAFANIGVGAAIFAGSQLYYWARSDLAVTAGAVQPQCTAEKQHQIMGSSLLGSLAITSNIAAVAMMNASLILTIVVLYGLTQYQTVLMMV